MRNTCCFVLLLSFSLVKAFSQDQARIDSLLYVLRHTSVDTSKVSALNGLSESFIYSQPEKARSYAEQAYKLATEIEDQHGIGLSLTLLGFTYKQQGEFDRALANFQESHRIRMEMGDLRGVASAHNNMGNIHRKRGEFDKALENYQQSLEIYERLNIQEDVARSCQNIGITYKNQGDFEEALRYMLRSLTIQESLKNDHELARAHLNLGNFYALQGLYNKALDYYTSGLQIQKRTGDRHGMAKSYNNLGNIHYQQQNLDLALQFFGKALELQQSLKYWPGLAGTYSNMGAIHREQGSFDLANRMFEESLELCSQLGDQQGMVGSYNNLGTNYEKQAAHEQALKYYFKALNLAKEVGLQKSAQVAHQNLARTYTHLGQYKLALEQSNSANALKDKLFNEERSRQIAEMQEKYEAEKRARQIDVLEKDNELQQAEVERQTTLSYTLILGVVLILLISVIIIRGYRQKQRAEALLASKNEELHRQKIRDLLNTQELKSIGAMLEGQEKERHRIAEDLHDRLGGLLSTVKLLFDGLRGGLDQAPLATQEQFEKATALLDESCGEVRRIAHDMVSTVLTNFGLVPALVDLSETVEATQKLNVDLLTFGLNERLENRIEIEVYHIVQEAISNFITHAQGTEITIQLNHHEGNLNLLIEDDGKGFDPQSKGHRGMGLKNMESRVLKLNGSIHLDSGRGTGTSISIDIPTSMHTLHHHHPATLTQTEQS